MSAYTALARFFRKSNSSLLVDQFWLQQKVRKIIFYISYKCYRFWVGGKHPISIQQVDSIDDNLIMEVDISKAIGAAFYWMGFHEFKEWCYLQKVLRADMVFFDIGANQGEYSLFAAKRLTSGRVVAFEPVAKFYKLLERNIELNHFKNIQANQLGLSAEPGLLPVFMDSKEAGGTNEGLASLFKSSERSQQVEEIRLETLDAMVEQLAIDRLDFMKIDVEGAELKVLHGGVNTLRQFRPQVMMEVSDVTCKAAGYAKEDIVQFFQALNYRAFVIKKDGVLAEAVQLPEFSNVIFLPQ